MQKKEINNEPKDKNEPSRDPNCSREEEGVSDEQIQYYSLGGDNDLWELERND